MKLIIFTVPWRLNFDGAVSAWFCCCLSEHPAMGDTTGLVFLIQWVLPVSSVAPLLELSRAECPSVCRERGGWVLGFLGTCRDPYSSMTIPCKLAALTGREWLEQSPPNAPPPPRRSPQSLKVFSTIFHITAGAESHSINMKGLSGWNICFPRTCPDIPNVM